MLVQGAHYVLGPFREDHAWDTQKTTDEAAETVGPHAGSHKGQSPKNFKVSDSDTRRIREPVHGTRLFLFGQFLCAMRVAKAFGGFSFS